MCIYFIIKLSHNKVVVVVVVVVVVYDVRMAQFVLKLQNCPIS